MSDCDPDLRRSEAAKGDFPADWLRAKQTACGRLRRLWHIRQPIVTFILLGSLVWAHPWVDAQTVKSDRQAAAITGVVIDPSGAVVRGAAVTLMSDDEPPVAVTVTKTGPTGRYRLDAGPGTCTLVVEAAGFARFESAPLRIAAAVSDAGPQAWTLDVELRLAQRIEKIEVPGESASSGNGNALVLSGRDVEQMPLDSATLLDELQSLAGGPNAQLYVSGFSGGKLPPRNNIGGIRIRQNAYSAEYDTDPGNGVIQVTTRPGTDQLHGEVYLYGDDSALNAGNPFAPGQPGYYANGSGGSLTGPLNHRASYFAGWDQLALEMNSAIDAQTLDANLDPAQVSYAVRTPRSVVDASSRLDLRNGASSTVMARYAFDRVTQTNGGIGQLALASQGFSNSTVAQTLQLSNTQLMGAKIVNETRFQYIRARAAQTPVSTDPAILVEGAFLGGGNDQGAFSDHQDRYELQNYVSLAEGRHYLKLGGRLRVGRDANTSLANFNGEFIFATLSAYMATAQGTPAASEFSLNTGSPNAEVAVADAGLFLEDDWKVAQNLTLSYGLRFETQTGIADHADWAPRVGFSWSPAKAATKGAPNYVLHGGAGVFYRRFSSDSSLQAERQNGVTQQEYVVVSPPLCPEITGMASTGCPVISNVVGLPGLTGMSGLAGLAAQLGSATVYRISPNFHAPYYIGESAAIDRRLGHFGTASLTYLNNRGEHTQTTENVNAPLPGTYIPTAPTSGVRPDGGNENIYEFVSEGVSRSNRLTTNVSVHTGRVIVYGYYMLRFDRSDAESDGSFPSDQYDLGVDYGRSLDDVRHTLTMGENAKLPYGIETSGYLRAMSGAPFNIVVGEDLNGDTQFNDRPAFATDLTRPSVVATRWGSFDTSPIAGQKIIPRNYAQGPGLFLVNLAVGKSLGFGPELAAGATPAKGPLPRKYTAQFWVQSQNALNHPNLTPPVGTLNSPLFGQSTGVTGASQLSADRVVDLQLSMRF